MGPSPSLPDRPFLTITITFATYQIMKTDHTLKQNPENIPPLGKRPVMLTCPRCKQQVMTIVNTQTSSTAYICCLLMIIIGCYICSCVPLCMNSFKNRQHSCPLCNAFIGLYKP
ncbi:lipopolysaccharide-induced tumor necrosis factor-alpha factor homolog [Myzus persicae]|uniref:lipopolysaccharide-induced tumor necrosis factor-alpha factor homolog n=1 Tax=Myzus persicae TaxID=13164 RepID=UPI000B933A45|nr:lipopolysaccharide-induced tumor necrosis factor-alpha factor homolog [Myzus persicae]